MILIVRLLRETMKRKTAAQTIQSLVIAIVVGAVPANFIGGFVGDSKDRGTVTILVWAMVALPGYILLNEIETK